MPLREEVALAHELLAATTMMTPTESSATLAERLLRRGGSTTDPIALWSDAVREPAELQRASLLRKAYESARPPQAEIIFTGTCGFRCVHCIYDPTYESRGEELEAERWLDLLTEAHHQLDISTFVYSGKSITPRGAWLLQQLRIRFEASRIGLIDNATSILRHASALRSVHLDWVDISLDGDERSHDRQRGRAGAHAAAMAGIEALLAERLASRLSILTCVTRINRHSVGDMIRGLNRRGVKNFVLTPVGVEPGVRPSDRLRLRPHELVDLTGELDAIAPTLEDAYIEIGLFEASDWYALRSCQTARGNEFVGNYDHLVHVAEINATTRTIRYFPTSLAGVRELVFDTDGRLLGPRAMAFVRAPSDRVLGDPRSANIGSLWKQFPQSPQFAMYVEELNREASTLSELQRR